MKRKHWHLFSEKLPQGGKDGRLILILHKETGSGYELVSINRVIENCQKPIWWEQGPEYPLSHWYAWRYLPNVKEYMELHPINAGPIEKAPESDRIVGNAYLVDSKEIQNKPAGANALQALSCAGNKEAKRRVQEKLKTVFESKGNLSALEKMKEYSALPAPPFLADPDLLL